jgi:hypothetical protein
MKTIKVGDRVMIMNGHDPLQYVDLTTGKLYKYPASIYLDETSDWPLFKWWRNPVLWWQWRKLLKMSKRNTKVILQTTPLGHNHFFEQEYPGEFKK